jgi:RimJ/RimL family protein N-acetyltransferase
MDGIEFHAHGLLLRPWQPEDAPAVLRACQDPEIHRWTNLPSPYLPEHAEHFVTTHTRQAWAERTGAPLGVFDPATGELLGANGLVNRRTGTGEIGYWVAPWARGRGVATRATHAVAAWALAALGLTRLVWRAEVGNHASRLVAQRLGFRLEGVQRAVARRAGRPPADCWSASLLPGELRPPEAPVDAVLRRRALTFGAPQPILTTTTAAGEPVTLRPVTLDDVDAMVAQCTDPDVLRWTTVPLAYGPEDAVAFVTGHAHDRWVRGEGAAFAIAGPDQAYAGSMELQILSGDTGDVGFATGPWARGRGYTAAALARLCRWGFDELGLYRVEWRAHVGNEPSRRVALRAGFRMEGVTRAGVRQRGERRDTWTGAMLATDATDGRTDGG